MKQMRNGPRKLDTAPTVLVCRTNALPLRNLSAENDEIIRREVDIRGTTRHARVRNSCNCPTQTCPSTFPVSVQHRM
jgi:hypothetical protein